MTSNVIYKDQQLLKMHVIYSKIRTVLPAFKLLFFEYVIN